MRTGIPIAALALATALACAQQPRDAGAAQPSTGVAAAQGQQTSAARLSEQLAAVGARAGGDVGVAVIHVESGSESAFQADKALPLFSVFKLPLAVAVLREVEQGRLRLDERVSVKPEEVLPGWRGNTDLWRKPGERTVEELLELSIARSDNTSSDKLLALVGGPASVTRLTQSMGLPDITIQSTVREYLTQGKNNTGTARDLARLLALLQQGKALGPQPSALLIGMMERATTGQRRLRGALPAGTRVADKTGTGAAGTNDVGLITLPEGRGHLAVAVLISNSKLAAEDQEKLIAELARAAYDAHAAQSKQ